jgi:aminoglycoside phosphotransferase (APT) family kinase protein
MLMPALHQFASTLAQFLVALQRIDAAGGPPPGQHNFFRGGPLTIYDGGTRRAIAALDGKIDTDAATAVWEAALAATWRDLPVWLHGDVSSGNLLVERGRLSAIIVSTSSKPRQNRLVTDNRHRNRDRIRALTALLH